MNTYRFLHDASAIFPHLKTPFPFVTKDPLSVHGTMALTHNKGPLTHLINHVVASGFLIGSGQRRLLARVVFGTDVNEEFASGTGYMTYFDAFKGTADRLMIIEIANALVDNPETLSSVRYDHIPGLAEWVVVNAVLAGWVGDDDSFSFRHKRPDFWQYCIEEVGRFRAIEKMKKAA